MWLTVNFGQKLYHAVAELALQTSSLIGSNINLDQICVILLLNHEGCIGIDVKERSRYDP